MDDAGWVVLAAARMRTGRRWRLHRGGGAWWHLWEGAVWRASGEGVDALRAYLNDDTRS